MVVAAKTPRADAALYWKAYALDKLGQKAEALATAAELMSRVLGMPDYGFAKIGHPVSSATDAGLEAMARLAIEQGRSMLVRP